MLKSFRKVARWVLESVGNLCLRFAKKIYLYPEEIRVIPWIESKGDMNYRVNYGLNEHSVVFDLGGYEGNWASDIFSRYCCTIHIFEPVPAYADRIRDRFSSNKHIHVHKFALAERTGYGEIVLKDDGSSMFIKEGKHQQIQLVDGIEFVRQEGIQLIHLMKINIEGSEYDLLDYIIRTGFIECIENIQVQFHDFVPDAQKRMSAIQEQLKATHDLTYQFPFIWENWKKRTTV
jgi:FkbM family methyltransferase